MDARVPAEGAHAFMPPARFAVRYRLRLLAWLLEGLGVLREALLGAWPRAVRRELAVTERVAELPFVLRALDLPRGSRVLDVGSQWSLLPLFLASEGYETVAADVSPVPIVGSGPAVVRADLRRPPFRAGSFDGATMVSTLEHVGVGFYDARRAEDDDLAVMRALRDLVRPGGLLVLTVPFGRPGVGPHQRAYDPARLRLVAEGWSREATRYLVRKGTAWRESTEAEASTVDSVAETNAVAMLRLRRP